MPSGLAYGEPRMGQPKTEEERRITHGGTPPPRGTGLTSNPRLSWANEHPGWIFFIGFILGGVAGYAFTRPERAVGKARQIKGAFE